ncbi:hypothetical protein V6N12_047596 [Hibiscus sabdariffa]|uniref:Uncharacterized protein n=1 Tax=Hibiscus sabdariffa TaxID=183260 RepID=A0ABR1ZRE2_9ROSI
MVASDGVGAGQMQWKKLFAASTPQSLGFYPPLISDEEMMMIVPLNPWGKLPIVLVLGASSISALGGVALQLQVGYVDVGASTSTSRAVTLEQPHVDFVVARLGPDLVQDSSTALIQIVDSLEQGAEPDFVASFVGHVHLELVLCSDLE